MSEENLWSWLRGFLPQGQYTRTEVGDTGPGFPDVHYLIPDLGGDPAGHTGTIELKFARRFQTPFPDEKSGLHKTQIEWITRNYELGGTVWIAAQVRQEVLFIRGLHARRFNGARLKTLIQISSLVLNRDGVIPHQLRMLRVLLERRKM